MIPPQAFAIIGIVILGIWSLWKLKQNFSMRLFYVIGSYLFIIQALAGSYGLFMEWGLLPVWALVSRIGSVLFNFLIAYFFYYLKKQAPAEQGGAGMELSPEEINKYLDNEED